MVQKPKVSVFVNGASEPSLVVNELTERNGGSVGLSFCASGAIANLTITPATDQPAAPASLPAPWRFVADDWNFGRVTFGPHRDQAGRTLDAFHFAYDGAAQQKQAKEVREAGRDFGDEAMSGRVDVGSHAVLRDSRFREGDIEADMCGSGHGDFQGIVFRASPEAATSGKSSGEPIYFRPFYANYDQPHYPSIQYFALHRAADGRKMSARLEVDPKIPKDNWFHARIEVSGTVAKVFLNKAEEPALVVPKLESDRSDGLVGFWGWNGRLTVTVRRGRVAPAARREVPRVEPTG